MEKEKLIKIIEERFLLTERSNIFDTYLSINKYEGIRIIERHSELEVNVNLGCFRVSKINIGKKTGVVYFISNDDKILNISKIKNLDKIDYIDGIDECKADFEMPTEETDLGLIDEEDLNEEYIPQWELNNEGVVSNQRYEELKNINHIKEKYHKYYNNFINYNNEIERMYWEKIFNDEVWLTRDGNPIKFADLDEEHTKNIIKMLNEFTEIRCELEDVFGRIQLKLLKELIKKEEL